MKKILICLTIASSTLVYASLQRKPSLTRKPSSKQAKPTGTFTPITTQTTSGWINLQEGVRGRTRRKAIGKE